jgi:hydrogenase nickel incorporation protein HypA/HybF
MHEYSIVDALLERVESEAEARRAKAVKRLRVRVGELAGLEVELFMTAYELFRERGVCRGAPMEVARIAARWECPRCGRSIEKGQRLRCTECNAPARLVEGDEIMLDQIELETDHV